jgi:hypothetical protein
VFGLFYLQTQSAKFLEQRLQIFGSICSSFRAQRNLIPDTHPTQFETFDCRAHAIVIAQFSCLEK